MGEIVFFCSALDLFGLSAKNDDHPHAEKELVRTPGFGQALVSS